ncbi:hypothetical protein PVAG01_09424 [Phlyctema vagabunda]|uniref:Altered inheritance of mitochondria protein 9, mitochondrial n=1 Tax=Phlyctema vagabunda TaxID=108571 RepID=A0ABR4P7G9_9HELO
MLQDHRVQKSSTPVLFHPDLHKRNIFVSEEDPTVITAFIDWQSASIEPAFWYADMVPDFAQSSASNQEDSKAEHIDELCAKAFDACTQFRVPKLSGPRLMDENLFRPFRYCFRTWKDGGVAFRHELIETSKRWTELGLEGQSPYVIPSREELDKHEKEYRMFVAAQELRYTLSQMLNVASDGWVPPDEFETARAGQKEIFEGILHEIISNDAPDDNEPLNNEDDLKEIWPFEL